MAKLGPDMLWGGELDMPCGRKRKKRKMAKHKRKKRLRRDRHKKK